MQYCHLRSTCFRNHRWRSSLHSTHSKAIHSTHRHAALEISFVLWSHQVLKKSSVRKLDSPWLWKLSMTCQRVHTCCELTHRFYPLCFHVLVLHWCTIVTILKLVNGGQTFTIIPVQFTSLQCLQSFFFIPHMITTIYTQAQIHTNTLKLGNKWCWKFYNVI